MSLYKGITTDESINWVKTDTVHPTVSETALTEGKALFVGNCATCHGIKKQLTGPALAGVQQRGPWENDKNRLIQWVHNPGAFIRTTTYTRRLAASYGGQIMPSFPQFSEDGINKILAFVNNEAGKAITDTFQLPVFTPDSTVIVSNEFDGFDATSSDDTLTDTSFALSMRDGFTDLPGGNNGYSFEINTLGWYNVDQDVAGLPGTTLCDLKVNVTGAADGASLNVYAFFPQHKNLSVSYHADGSIFHFDKIENKIPLYLGETGTIMVFGNKGNQFYFGKANFTVKLTQLVPVNLQPVNKLKLIDEIGKENMEGIQFRVAKQQ